MKASLFEILYFALGVTFGAYLLINGFGVDLSNESVIGMTMLTTVTGIFMAEMVNRG